MSEEEDEDEEEEEEGLAWQLRKVGSLANPRVARLARKGSGVEVCGRK